MCFMHGLIRYSCIYEPRLSPGLNGSSSVQYFKHGNVIKICDEITFDFYIHGNVTYLVKQKSSQTKKLTSVSGACTNVYFFRISMRAILASMRANLMPIQLRGPQPKGMWQRAGRFAFSSGVNLGKRRTDGWRIGENEGERTVPFRVKFLWFWPEFWVVVNELDGELNCCSLGDGDSVDLNSLLTMTCIAVMYNISYSNLQ